MSDQMEAPPRPSRAARKSDRVDGLVDAALEEIREKGYPGLTVRNVARRAGVAPATAYTYFASRDHLVAEVFWRRLRTLDAPRSRSTSASVRLRAAIRDLTHVIAEEPELAAASTSAMLAADQDVERLRLEVGAFFRGYFAAALQDAADPACLTTLNLAFVGALLNAGMGFVPYADLADLLADVIEVTVGRRQA
jgi:AcrR family transcriptional regulator